MPNVVRWDGENYLNSNSGNWTLVPERWGYDCISGIKGMCD
jgi:hypothetical protein